MAKKLKKFQEFIDKLKKEESEFADLTISEAVDILKREGFKVSTQKLRQYETQGIIRPQKTESQYRLYKGRDLRRIRKILLLIMIGWSIKKIKKYFEFVDRMKADFKEYNTLEKEREKASFKKKGEIWTVMPGEFENKYRRMYLRLTELSEYEQEIKERIEETTKILSKSELIDTTSMLNTFLSDLREKLKMK